MTHEMASSDVAISVISLDPALPVAIALTANRRGIRSVVRSLPVWPVD
jgi:hypothetical protein